MVEPNSEVSPDSEIIDDDDLGFEDGLDAGEEQAKEQLEDQLIDEGFDPDEVEELLYDPSPRRRRGKRRHRRYRRYDPSPRRHRRRGRGRRRYDPAVNVYSGGKKYYPRKKKGILRKLKPLVMPGTAGVTFFASYLSRTSALIASGALPATANVFDAIMYDVNHFDGNAAITRLSTNLPIIAGSTIGGILVKEFAPGQSLKLIGDVLLGIGTGIAAKAILDPPITKAAPASRAPSVNPNTASSPTAANTTMPCLNCGDVSIPPGYHNPFAGGQ